MKRLFTVTVAMLCAAAAPAWAFPLDGTYFAECAGEGAGDGVGAEGALVARLTFPEICFDGACCDLSNPTRLRGLPDQFLYDGACRAEGEAFEARIFFGAGPDSTSIVIVLRDRAATLDTCLPEPPLDDA
jgi:hypothetical protein